MNDLSGYRQAYYRLSPAEPWHEVTDKRNLSFVNMMPGTYHFQLAGKMPDGKWTDLLFSTNLVVIPFYYQTIWFRILLLVLAVILTFYLAGFIIRYREKQAEKERMLRLQIAGDLHDEVGSMLTGMSLQADFLLQGRGNKSREYLENIAGSGRSAIQVMSDIVWSIDPNNDDTLSLVRRLRKHGQQVFDPTEITFTLSAYGDTDAKYLSQKVRQNIMLIFKEALTNICKHAEATEVKAFITITDHRIKLVISDNGKGMPKDRPAGHGLRNMRMRAEAVQAILSLPETEKGVTIALEFGA